MLLFISGPEIFIILLVVVLLFGAKKIPELAKGLGKGMKELKKATDSIKREIDDADLMKDITKDVKEMKNNMDDMKPKL